MLELIEVRHYLSADIMNTLSTCLIVVECCGVRTRNLKKIRGGRVHVAGTVYLGRGMYKPENLSAEML